MPPTILPGPETSIQNVDNNVRGMDANVYELEPNVSPLVSLSDAMGSVSSDNPKAEWLEDESLPRITTTTGAINVGTFTYPVTLDIFRIGDVVRFSGYGYGLLVTAHSAGSVTGTIIGTQAATTASGSEMYIVSNANAEGATLREIEILQLVTQFNYCEIVRTPFGVTTTELGTLHYGGDERARLSKKFGMEHARSIEQIAFFGLRGINGTTRTAGGLLSYIATNVTADTGGLTVGDWEAFLKQGFRYGSETKVAYCSPTAIAAIEGFARNNLRVSNDTASTYGVKMSTYVSGQGEVHLVKHKDWNDSSVYNGYVFLVDMDAVRLRPLRNVGGTRLLKDRQAPDYDGVKDEYRSETCLQVMHERRHALLTGVT
jgi:Family of unknown function (DUF5309)